MGVCFAKTAGTECLPPLQRVRKSSLSAQRSPTQQPHVGLGLFCYVKLQPQQQYLHCVTFEPKHGLVLPGWTRKALCPFDFSLPGFPSQYTDRTYACTAQTLGHSPCSISDRK